VAQALSLNNGDITATARQLGVARQQIYRIMKRHGLKRNRINNPDAGPK
jgi:transcriptional regulator of acetoin/glycerol metabolism